MGTTVIPQDGRDSGVEGVATAELDVGWIGVLTDPAGVVTDNLPAFIDLLREDAVCRMEVFGVSTGEDPIDLVVLNPGLELGAELSAQGKALLLAGEIHDVFTGVHHRGAACWQLKA